MLLIIKVPQVGFLYFFFSVPFLFSNSQVSSVHFHVLESQQNISRDENERLSSSFSNRKWCFHVGKWWQIKSFDVVILLFLKKQI